MELLDNVNRTLKEDLEDTIKRDSKISLAAAYFSIYAYQELKYQFEQIDEFRFIFTSPTFVTDKVAKESREFYIPRIQREKGIYGTEFEVRLRNELTQKAIARECADWIRSKATFKSNITAEIIMGFLNVDDTSYYPINGFTTVDLGCERGNNMFTAITKTNASENSRYYLRKFDEVWNDTTKLQDVTDEIIESISAAYNENSPEFIYFVTLYNIFNEFLEDISEDVLPNEATGFKESKIWGMLYNFQRDAALAIINKLEKYNGCILADSVGLGKSFTALAVIKYYENRNKSVLVLCPKKLASNWNTYKDNYINNPIASDRLRYDVLFHTDLSRDFGTSNGLDLDRLNWGNYDLVVIDESHNFRNGGKVGGEDEKENRYLRLLNKVIRTVFSPVGFGDEHAAANRTAFHVLIPENLRFQRPVQRQDRPAEPLTADRERNRLRAGAGVPIIKDNAVAVLTATALPAYQAGRLFPLRRCHAVKGTVRPAFQWRQVFIGVISHAFPPFCFPLPFSPKSFPASSSQAAYRSFHRKRQNSLAPLLLLSPQSHAALRGPRQ